MLLLAVNQAAHQVKHYLKINLPQLVVERIMKQLLKNQQYQVVLTMLLLVMELFFLVEV
jgi:hypothetical protein